jgi:dethiobiotin synthetase/adenosylmethionine--8-amino-7-oxononanoate aminotransferase
MVQAQVFNNMDEIMNVENRLLTRLAALYTEVIEKVFSSAQDHKKVIGAVVIEPIFIGAGGFKLVDPLFQHTLVTLSKARGIPVVYDEVAVGMWRLGPVTTSSILKVFPDIAVYGKLLTGGYLPLAVTLATEETFDAFLSIDKQRALLHGHSYTASPICCGAALEAIRQFQNSPMYNSVSNSMRPSFLEEDAMELSALPGVESSVCLGSILTVDMCSDAVNSGAARALEVVEVLRNKGIYARPLSNTVYIMTSQVTSRDQAKSLVETLNSSIRLVLLV